MAGFAGEKLFEIGRFRFNRFREENVVLEVDVPMKVEFEYPLEAATGVPPVPATPKNLSRIGVGTQVAQPGAKLVPPRAARFL